MFPDLFRDDVFRIETRRLWLRWPTARDADAILRLAGDPAVADMTARIPVPLDRATVDEFLVASRAANAAGTGLVLALCERARPGRAIGVVSIERRPEGCALGYWLGRPHWGQGLMTEAAQAVVHAFFAWTGNGRLASAARVENAASRRVLEKAGFAWAGRGTDNVSARGGEIDVDRFVLDRGRWLTGSGDPSGALAAAE